MAFSSEDFPNRFDYATAQSRIYEFWQSRGYFHADPDPSKKPHVIMIPLPNVTGALHLGHALNGTVQDLLTRWRRMQGYEALWMPGTDHAGIATQSVVERRMLEEEGLTRHDVGREALVKRIWKWKDAYELRILSQLKELGASCDWRRTRFTLDDVCSRAVRRTFLRLFRDGLIYRGKRLVNWDTYLQTAVADDEVFHEEVDGNFWTFSYPVVGSDRKISFSTTRPETMLGDTAVCVHPKDERYADVIGKLVRLPLVDRDIPIIADGQLAKMDMGTGAVKVTPAHDPNDYACALRNDLEMINILNQDGTLNENAGKYAGMRIMEARSQVVDDMQELGLYDGAEERKIDLAHSDRSKTPIEPYLSDQWFVQMEQLAEAAIKAVQDERVRFFPVRYAKTYLDWLGEKRDWCISRQLWWGHRIPIWYCDTCQQQDLQAAFGNREDICWRHDEQRGVWLICSEQDLASDCLGARHELVQDEDVLDTWFSSALWPHSTLGWPNLEQDPPLHDAAGQNTGDQHPHGGNRVLDYFYPGSVLVTSRDIITLWVARMVLTGLYNMDDIPFAHVCVHPKILDGFGQTMSKTKGNGVDPMDLIEKYGTDAVRFTIASFAGETQDVRLPMQYECPHCGTAVPQALDKDGTMVKPQSLKSSLRGSADKPRMPCPSCKKESQFSTPQYDPDPGEPVARMVSERFEYGRNFCNKLWNASRFALLNLTDFEPAAVADDELAVEDRWILSRLSSVTQQVTDALNVYHLDDAARTIYDFAWDEFCSFYIEMVKGRLQDEHQRLVASRVLAHTLDTLLRILHPMMPFITEEVWQLFARVAPQRGLPDPTPAAASVMIAPWPQVEASRRDEQIEARFARFQSALGAIREIRSRQNIAPKETIEFYVNCDEQTSQLLQPMEPYFNSMANARSIAWRSDVELPKPRATVTLPSMEIHVDLKNFIDTDAECQRLKKQQEKIAGMIQGKEKKLGNENFVKRAPADVVQREREAVVELREQLSSVRAALAEMKCPE